MTKTHTLSAQLQEATQRIADLTAQLEKRDAQITENGSELISLRAQLDDLTGQQGESQRRTREQAVLIGDKNLEMPSAINQAQESQDELQAKEQEIAVLKLDLKDRDVKLQSAALQIRTLERRAQELVRLLSGVEEIRHTGSYRLVRTLSAPLRWKYRKTLKRYIQRVKSRSVNQRLRLKSQGGTNREAGLSTNTQGAEKESKAGLLLNPEAWRHALQRLHSLIVTTLSKSHMGALFDAEWYLRENPDVAQAKRDPLAHYLRQGASEGRAPHPLFDPKFYLTTYPEAAIGGGANALQHYLTQGWKKGYKPNPRFDPSFYLEMYPDVAEAGCEPLTHFVTNGLREGRSGCLEDVYLEPFAFEAEFEISREHTPATSTVESDIKAIAFYLPQFHAIPENDEWWGTGFTEWTNVRRGEPQFKDHHQPHVPSDLGYYDLRETAVLEKQIALAQAYGIYGFCLYYYWFAGKILLDLPIRYMMERGKPDFPFCICWANENWTRRWDGLENDILIGQQHSPEDDLAFLRHIESILLHKNYIRVEGKPLLIVYQPSFLPDAQATAARWREAFRERGHGEIFLAAAQTFEYRSPPHEYGFDAVIQFPPHTAVAPVLGLAKEVDRSFAGYVYDYNQTKWSFIHELSELSPSRRIYPGVMPSWDNTARRQKKSSIWINSSPESYYDWLRQVSSFLRKTKSHDDKLVFINAWNEWAEGCHLEPDESFGYSWLNATRLALQSEGAATD
jgi:hypothetical protein